MTTISINDGYFGISCSLKDDGPTAEEMLRSFVGLMFTQTYGLGSIRAAAQEIIDELDEHIKVYNENNSNE